MKALAAQVAVLGDQKIQHTASIGIALLDCLRAAEVLEFADLAMYEAKEAGRNRVAAYGFGRGQSALVSRRTEVELIRTALDEDRLLLYCQPILDLKDGTVSQ